VGLNNTTQILPSFYHQTGFLTSVVFSIYIHYEDLEKKKKRDKLHWTRNAGKTAIPNGHGVNLFLADACPLLCKLSTRQIAQTPDNGGSRASLRGCLYGVLNHPIVSVPNQPEIPAFVASVFIRRTMGDASCDRKRRRGPSCFRRNYPRRDNTVRRLAAPFGRLDCHENIRILEERER